MSLIHTCYRILDIDRLGQVLRGARLRGDAAGADPRRGRQRVHGPPRRRVEPRLELTYNFGVTEPYEIGTGYGHIAITTTDLDGTLERLAEQGIEPERPPYTIREGGNRLCFVRDPDGYRIEILERALSLMVDTATMGKLLERFAQGVAAHDRENPGHNSWGIGMSHFDIERLGLEEGEELLPGIVLQADSGVTGNFRVLCDGEHDSEGEFEEQEVVDAVASRGARRAGATSTRRSPIRPPL